MEGQVRSLSSVKFGREKEKTAEDPSNAAPIRDGLIVNE
jgi:hypothetical protein